MALDSVGILRNGVPISAPWLVLPNEPITLFAQLGAIGGDIVRFTITTAPFPGQVVFGPVEKRTDFFSSQVRLDIVAPGTPGNYIVVATELRPFWPDDTKLFGFGVSPDAPPPPEDGGNGGGFFGNWKTLLIIGGIVVAVVALSPTINRGAGYLIPRKD